MSESSQELIPNKFESSALRTNAFEKHLQGDQHCCMTIAFSISTTTAIARNFANWLTVFL